MLTVESSTDRDRRSAVLLGVTRFHWDGHDTLVVDTPRCAALTLWVPDRFTLTTTLFGLVLPRWSEPMVQAFVHQVLDRLPEDFIMQSDAIEGWARAWERSERQRTLTEDGR